MRYSISNAIPHNPKSEKHPYENLVNTGLAGEMDIGGAGVLCQHLFLQLGVGDLAHQRLGHVLLELDVIGHGMFGDVLAAVVRQHGFGCVVGLNAGG